MKANLELNRTSLRQASELELVAILDELHVVLSDNFIYQIVDESIFNEEFNATLIYRLEDGTLLNYAEDAEDAESKENTVEKILTGLEDAGFIKCEYDIDDNLPEWECYIYNDLGVYVGDILLSLGFKQSSETTKRLNTFTGRELIMNWVLFENEDMVICHRDLAEHKTERFTIEYKKRLIQPCEEAETTVLIKNNKTQISQLINGNKNVKRDLKHPKYINSPRATGHSGFGGTNREERIRIATQVIAENPKCIHININGILKMLPASYSTSGKTAIYSAALRRSEYICIVERVPEYTYEAMFELVIHGDMKIEIHKYTRKNKQAPWRLRGYDHIGEEFVVIL